MSPKEIVNLYLKSCTFFNSVADPDPHLKSPPGSGSASVHADPDPGGKKA